MRAIVDLLTHQTALPQIVQVEQTPAAGRSSATPINGRYLLPIVKGAEFPIDTSSYVLAGGPPIDVDGGDVSSISYAYLLAMYPQFGTVYFNPLLTAGHLDELDFTATFKDDSVAPPVYYPVRLQTGREASLLLQTGQMPTHTAVLPVNAGVTPNRPGVMITDAIDISSYTIDPVSGLAVGADQFMVYWKLYDFSVSDDYAGAIAGPLNGLNEPAIRSVSECEQEPTGFSVYLSPDDGDHWCQVGLLEPIAFCEKTTSIRLAFVNTSTSKVYIATYGVLF
jgi:hypothetical protein